ncbi:replication protein A 70 kDa DNA-binding subunit C [Trifolium repens]|nr:replication protein A 70 kDa DNA-binding subunit C [Trifolium repens]
MHQITVPCQGEVSWQSVSILFGIGVIQVRVLRLWKVSAFLNPSETSSIEMVLVDEKGGKIHTTIRKQMLLTSLAEVCGHSHDYEFLVDVIGLMTGVSAEREYIGDGKVTKMVVVELADASGKCDCALFGDYVGELKKKMGKAGEGLPVVLIQFAKVKIFRDQSSLQNVINTTRILIFINTQFETTVHPNEGLIPIPSYFNDVWKRCNFKNCICWKKMNIFSMVVVEDIESQGSCTGPQKNNISSSDDEDENQQAIEIYERVNSNGEAIHTVFWSKSITESMVGSRSTQTLVVATRFLQNQRLIILRCSETGFSCRCEIKSSKQADDNGFYGKRIADGWQKFIYDHSLETGDNLHLEMSFYHYKKFAG